MVRAQGGRRLVPLLVAGVVVFGASWLARADGIPAEPAMYYAGTLEEGGVPVTGPRDIRVTLWDDETSVDVSRQLCRAVPDADTMVENGRFRVALTDDGACTQGIRASSEVWVEVTVEGMSLGRSRIGAVPYAVVSESAQNGAPPGSVMAFAGAIPPPGWLVCDGAPLVSADYPALFAAIRTAWGNGTEDGDPATDFNLPDLRGRFLRGVDGAAGVDPDAAARVAPALGANTGDRVGSVQDDAFQGHAHRHNLSLRTLGGGGGPIQWGGDAQRTFGAEIFEPVSDGTHGSVRIASETRPINAGVVYLIKY